jgi:hypothetical protein
MTGVEPTADLVHALVRKHSTPRLRSYLGMTGTPADEAALNRRPGHRRSEPATVS